MKKNLKKLFAIVMTVAVVLSMAMPTMAEETKPRDTYTLTIEKQNEYGADIVYNVYQLMVADIDRNIVAEYKTDGAKNGTLVGSTTVEQLAKMEEKSDELYAFAAAIVEANPDNPYAKLTPENSSALSDEIKSSIQVPAGYYLLVPTEKAATADIDSDTYVNAGGVVSAPILTAVPKIELRDKTYHIVGDGNVTVTAKESDVTHKKKISAVDSNVDEKYDGSVGNNNDTATTGEDDIITYTITNTVPKYEADVEKTEVNYFVVDDYDEKYLELVEDSITVTQPSTLTKAENESALVTTPDVKKTGHTVYTVNGADYVVKLDSGKFIVYFNYASISAQTDIVITVNFKIKKEAIPGTAIVNDSTLTYTNNYHTGTDSTLADEVKSWTFNLKVFKYDTKSKQPLAGAKFALYKSIEDANGTNPDAKFIVEGESLGDDAENEKGVVNFGDFDLNEGEYYLKETQAPNGYRVDDTIHKVVVKATKNASGEYTGEYTVEVDEKDITNEVKVDDTTIYNGDEHNKIPVFGIGNTPGTTLPGTGGIGTTIFTFGGLALIVLAGILLVVYTRKQKKAKV